MVDEQRIKAKIAETLANTVAQKKADIELVVQYGATLFTKNNPGATDADVEQYLAHMRKLIKLELEKETLEALERDPEDLLDSIMEDDE